MEHLCISQISVLCHLLFLLLSTALLTNTSISESVDLTYFLQCVNIDGLENCMHSEYLLGKC